VPKSNTNLQNIAKRINLFIKGQSLYILLVFAPHIRSSHIKKILSFLLKLKYFFTKKVYKIFKSLLVGVKHLHNKLGYHGDITP